jgi:RNA polymerase primary sigma factor
VVLGIVGHSKFDRQDVSLQKNLVKQEFLKPARNTLIFFLLGPTSCVTIHASSQDMGGMSVERIVCQPKLSRDRAFHQYYGEVGRTEMLTPKAERELFNRYRKKDDLAARDKLIHNCLRSVVKIANQYSRNADTIKDLISAGNLGVLHALKRYDPKKKTRFLSYATYWIQLFIREEVYDADLVTMPRWRQKAIRKVKRVNSQYHLQEGRRAEDDEICAEADLSPTQLSRLRRIERLQFSPLDILTKASQSSPNDDDRAAFNTTLDNEVKQLLSRYLKVLGPKENFVLRAYFGLVTDPMSLRQIANVIGVSSERVRQVKVHALTQLRKLIEFSLRRDFNSAEETGESGHIDLLCKTIQ